MLLESFDGIYQKHAFYKAAFYRRRDISERREFNKVYGYSKRGR